jgi:hypothetical protein
LKATTTGDCARKNGLVVINRDKDETDDQRRDKGAAHGRGVRGKLQPLGQSGSNRRGVAGVVSILYFLQPIVRGLARYQGRLTTINAPMAARQTLKSGPHPA